MKRHWLSVTGGVRCVYAAAFPAVESQYFLLILVMFAKSASAYVQVGTVIKPKGKAESHVFKLMRRTYNGPF